MTWGLSEYSFEQGKNEIQLYKFDFANLMDPSDSLYGATFTLSSDHIEMLQTSGFFQTYFYSEVGVVIDFVENVIGNTYQVACKVTTNAGLIIERTINITFVER
jgi:hypothetical protein